jgi:uncharacterized protein
MDAYIGYLNNLVNNNKSVFSKHGNINWINPYLAPAYQELRDQLVMNCGNELLFKGTKPYYRHISKGCQLCGAGTWSCLFITGKCNAHCFYCPAQQNKDEIPATQGLTFATPRSYAEYIHHFGFKGVSFSGGEPFLVFERVLDYLGQIRKICSRDVYIWMYTNGILASRDKFSQLAQAGLDEVRFDIGATNYSLDKVKLASGIVPNITIEIPAIPEEKERLKNLLPRMAGLGVTNLNLHQLRLSEYNAPKLLDRGYTFIPAEKPIVMESELTALEIIDYARGIGLEMGINYCAYFFKSRFQPTGYRKRLTGLAGDGPFQVTEKGFIREKTPLTLNYKTLRLTDTVPQTLENILQLEHKSYAFGTRDVAIVNMDGTNAEKLEALLSKEPDKIPDNPALFSVWMHEYIEKGLRGY